jgi:O-6-methylguanine DNA methyltransferase
MAKKASKTLIYTVFSTNWGYFGLAGTHAKLIRTHLPLANCNRVVQNLLASLGPAGFDARYFQQLQERIKAYYQGAYIDGFGDVRVNLRQLSRFTAAVLRVCRKIKPGRTVTYAQLAKMTGRPKAVRAVGSALARNPLPLIIPCHRVIRTDGKVGGFSAAGGQTIKKRMLSLEEAVVKQHQNCLGKEDP